MNSAFPHTIKNLAQQVREARVDHTAFEALIRPCEMNRCKATCCYDGVHLSDEEATHVEQIASENDFNQGEAVITVSPKGGKKTATRVALDSELASDYPVHFPKTRCVFLDENSYCELQKYSMQKERHPWHDKPLTCWIHPLVLIPAGKWEERPVLTLVDSQSDPQKASGYPGFASCTHCGREDLSGSPAWQVLEAELKMLGELCNRNIYEELSADKIDWIREE